VGPYLWISAFVAFALLQVPTVGPYLATVAYISIMIAGILRSRARDRAKRK
jgi:hypothetical protein